MRLAALTALLLLASAWPLIAAEAGTYARINDQGQPESGGYFRADAGSVRVRTQGGARPWAEAVAIGRDRDGSTAISRSRTEGDVNVESHHFRGGDGDWHLGNGIHSFWSGRYEAAKTSFLEAQRHAAHDARPLYFLALTYRKLGDVNAADETLQHASLVAAAHPVAEWGTFMMRVQGKDRLWVESCRLLARVARQANR